MWLQSSLAVLGLSAQVPLTNKPPSMSSPKTPFALKQGDVFSPQDLVELGRPSAGVANNAGDLVMVSFSKFDLKEKENKKSVFISPTVDSVVQPLEILLAKGDQAFWLDGQTVAHVVEADGKLDLYVFGVEFQPTAGILKVQSERTLVGSIPSTSSANFRFVQSSGYLVFSDLVYADGNLTTVKEQDEAWENRGNTALVYDSGYERHWDTWTTPKKQTLFSVRLQKDPDHVWHLGSEFKNVLLGTGHNSPVEPFGGTDDFDISSDYIIYTTKDTVLPEAEHTRQNVYLVNISGSKPKELTSGKQGATHSPVLNAKSTLAAWLEMDEDGYEADRSKIVIYDLVKDVRFTLTQDWDRSPDALAFSKDGQFLYFTAGDNARIKTWVLPIPPTPSKSTTHPELAPKYTKPVVITETGAASGLQALYYGRILVTISSLTSPNDVYLVNVGTLEKEIQQSDSPVKFKGEIHKLTNFTAQDLQSKKLSSGEDFYFKGAEMDIHGWALKPVNWEEGQKKKYPVVLLIHGGPQGAWEDQWSTRWNPNVFTGQGYFVIALNPTGSTTFGQKLTDGIAGDWGGKPFVDMQLGWKYALQKFPEIDADRAVAAGASWGGYAINWIQGHPEYGFNFKALVCHDGVFDSRYNGFSTDELFFFIHEWKGAPWEKEAKALLEKYNPSNFVDKWSTPQLIIHGSKDYRLPDTEGIGAYHALLQQGIPTRLVVFPNENHWVLQHGNSLKWHYEVFRWLDQFVGEK
ncbi:Alpha/Beta hydrolase protein [Mycena floridula]|nr:Alpha/Beta hydrolase protein [Mycena floridula]